MTVTFPILSEPVGAGSWDNSFYYHDHQSPHNELFPFLDPIYSLTCVRVEVWVNHWRGSDSHRGTEPFVGSTRPGWRGLWVLEFGEDDERGS